MHAFTLFLAGLLAQLGPMFPGPGMPASSGSANTWTLVQVKDKTGCTSPCSVTVTSTGAGHLIVAAVSMSNSGSISAVSGGGTYTLCGTPCRTGDSTTGYNDIAYTTSSASGATSVSITYSGGGNSVGIVWEYSSSLGTATLDTANHNLVSSNCSSCAGTTLTLTGTSDVISTIGSCGGSCSAISAGYTNDLANPSGEEVAHALNTSSGTAPTLTQSPSSHMATAAIAFK